MEGQPTLLYPTSTHVLCRGPGIVDRLLISVCMEVQTHVCFDRRKCPAPDPLFTPISVPLQGEIPIMGQLLSKLLVLHVLLDCIGLEPNTSRS